MQATFGMIFGEITTFALLLSSLFLAIASSSGTADTAFLQSSTGAGGSFEFVLGDFFAGQETEAPRMLPATRIVLKSYGILEQRFSKFSEILKGGATVKIRFSKGPDRYLDNAFHRYAENYPEQAESLINQIVVPQNYILKHY